MADFKDIRCCSGLCIETASTEIAVSGCKERLFPRYYEARIVPQKHRSEDSLWLQGNVIMFRLSWKIAINDYMKSLEANDCQFIFISDYVDVEKKLRDKKIVGRVD
ncbi:hypothetical protein TNCT_542701 [Trichonephila clavata]|uniref:Uncharacterized protein n=1 Tax=Trichonephila clavata TaxID=2740835 RepID=A0A8X6FXJ3_TRICU|nr:hypothetical protein TNCT_542701 [Trichonephila clavata]